MSEKQDDYFDDIATHLMGVRGPATLRHLNKLAPGAFEALTPKVPALRDPRKGGRRDIDLYEIGPSRRKCSMDWQWLGISGCLSLLIHAPILQSRLRTRY